MKLLKNESIRIFLFFCALLSIAFYDVVFLGKTFKATLANSQAIPEGVYGQTHNKPRFIPVNGTDSPVMEEPVFAFIRKYLRQGILPLWNPHQACGYPLIGMLEVGFFYPLNFILYFFPEMYSWDILILLRILLAGLFTYWLMRILGFPIIPCCVSAVVFMLSGPMVLLQYWTVNVDLLTPLILIACEFLIRKTTRQQMALLSFVMALTILAGHPEHIIFANLFGLLFFLFRLYSARKDKNIQHKKAILYFILAVLLGTAMSAIALLPFLHNFFTEFWHAHPEGVGVMMEENRARALSLALPHFFQREPVTYQWDFAGWWGGYLGTLPLALAFLSLFTKKAKGLNFFFFALGLLTVSKAYGLPFINWIGHLPIFNLIRYAIHTPPFVAFAFAICAGIGVHAVFTEKNLFSRGHIFSSALLITVGGHLIALRNSEKLPLALKATVFALFLLVLLQILLYLKDKKAVNNPVMGGMLLMIVFLELFLYIHRERPKRFSSFAPVPYIELLKSASKPLRSYGNFWAFYPNTATGFGVDDLGYFFSLVPKRFVHFINSIVLNNYFQDNLRPPALRAIPIAGKESLLDLFNVKYIIHPASDLYRDKFPHFAEATKDLELVYNREVKVYQRPNTFPRVYTVHRAIFQPDPALSLRLIYQIGGQLKDVIVINQTTVLPIAAYLKNIPAHDLSTARIVKYTPNAVIIDAYMENGGFLVFNDAYHPDWQVRIDGERSKIFQTNYLFRSVFLKEGRHTVQFNFKPFSFYLGLWVSILSALITLGLFFPFRVKPDTESKK